MLFCARFEVEDTKRFNIVGISRIEANQRVTGLSEHPNVQESLDLAHESSLCCICVPDEEQDQNHSDKWNQPSNHYDGIENVGGRALAQIRIVADQFERNDGADS